MSELVQRISLSSTASAMYRPRFHVPMRTLRWILGFAICHARSGRVPFATCIARSCCVPLPGGCCARALHAACTSQHCLQMLHATL